MPQINFNLEKEVDEKVIKFSNKWKLSKPETIKKIISDFKESEDEQIL